MTAPWSLSEPSRSVWALRRRAWASDRRWLSRASLRFHSMRERSKSSVAASASA